MIGLPLTLPLDAAATRFWSITDPNTDDPTADGGAMLLAITITPAEARAVAGALMRILGQPMALDADLADQIGWAGRR